MSENLDNYLRMYRKRIGLSQGETGLVVNARGQTLSRYERFERLPTLEVAFAYEVLFATPMQELFAGAYEEVERATRRRSQELLAELDAKTDDLKRKVRHLQLIAGLPVTRPRSD